MAQEASFCANWHIWHRSGGTVLCRIVHLRHLAKGQHSKEKLSWQTQAEVEKALKREKAAKPDGTTAGLLKDGGDIVLEKLAKLFSECLRTSTQKNGNIILIHKKKDAKDLKNPRSVSLLLVVYKLLTKITVNSIHGSPDIQQLREQAGFMKGYLTVDHIHVLILVVEKPAEYNKPLYMAAIDYEKAFHSVSLQRTWFLRSLFRAFSFTLMGGLHQKKRNVRTPG